MKQQKSTFNYYNLFLFVILMQNMVKVLFIVHILRFPPSRLARKMFVRKKCTKTCSVGGFQIRWLQFCGFCQKVLYPACPKPRAGPGQTNRPDAPIPCAVSKNLANRDATCLPWVDTHKPEKRAWWLRDMPGISTCTNTPLWPRIRSKREAVEARHGQSAAMPCP